MNSHKKVIRRAWQKKKFRFSAASVEGRAARRAGAKRVRMLRPRCSYRHAWLLMSPGHVRESFLFAKGPFWPLDREEDDTRCRSSGWQPFSVVKVAYQATYVSTVMSLFHASTAHEHVSADFLFRRRKESRRVLSLLVLSTYLSCVYLYLYCIKRWWQYKQ